jgi:uncharacterized protein (DUF58 family)
MKFDSSRFDPEVLQELGRVDLIARIIVQGIKQGAHRTRMRGFSTEFSDFRVYSPGDDLRFLDWHVYARLDRLFIKCYEAETSQEVLILLDATRSMAWRWEDNITKLEYAANLLAAIACLHMAQHDQVGLLVHDANKLHSLPPRARRTQLEEIVAILSNVEPGGADSLHLLIDDLAQRSRHRGQIIICSDLLEEPEGVSAALKALVGRDDEVILFHILDHAELTLPFSKATHLQDSESDEIISVNMGNLKAGHDNNVEEFRGHWREECLKLGIQYLPLHTKMNYVEVVRDLLRERDKHNVRRAV